MADGGATSILVVDDDALITRVLVRQFARRGLAAEACPGGRMALARLQELRPDVLVTDLVMPDLDGIAVCRAATAQSKPPVVVLISGQQDVGDRLRAFDAGASDFLVKPFTFDELWARVQVHLRETARPAKCGVVSYLGVSVNLSDGVASVEGRPIDLTRSQFRLLAGMLAEPGRVFSFQELRALAGCAGDDRAIRKLVERLRAALGPAGSSITNVWGRGYGFAPRKRKGASNR